jgi:hypothetical protein
MAISNGKIEQLIHTLSTPKKEEHEISVAFINLIDSEGFEINDFSRILNIRTYTFLTVPILIDVAKKAISIYSEQVIEQFYDILRFMLTKNKINVIDFTVNLIIDLDGKNREAGRKTWDELSLYESDFDALNLSQQQQALFIISMLQDLCNPEFRLPKILPLFNSQDDIIRQILYVELVKYCDSYLSIVKEYFDKYVTLSSKQAEEFVNFYNSYVSFMKQRANCKELSSKFSQPALYEETYRQTTARMRELSIGIEKEIEQLTKDLSIKKVRPARGHIYIDYDGKLKTFTPVRRFAHFPNSVNALSALESTEYMMKISDNWDKITDICEIL